MASTTSDLHALDAQLRPALEEIDSERVAQLKRYLSRMNIVALGSVAAAVMALLAYTGLLGASLDRFHFGIYVLAPVLTGIALTLWADEPRQRYASAYKERVMPVIAGSLGDFDYFEHGWIDPDRITGSTLIPVHDTYHSEDMFCGVHDGVSVDLAEVRLTNNQGGANRQSITVFNGLFVLISLQKAFAGKTVVKRDAGAFANWLGEKSSGMERVTLENPEFDEQFKVFATDQIEARYLLTPAFMERLSALATDMGDGHLQAAFYDQQLLVMVPNSTDLFEPPSIFTSVLNDTGVNRIAREFGDVLSMIDTLKLNEQTGL